MPTSSDPTDESCETSPARYEAPGSCTPWSSSRWDRGVPRDPVPEEPWTVADAGDFGWSSSSSSSSSSGGFKVLTASDPAGETEKCGPGDDSCGAAFYPSWAVVVDLRVCDLRVWDHTYIQTYTRTWQASGVGQTRARWLH